MWNSMLCQTLHVCVTSNIEYTKGSVFWVAKIMCVIRLRNYPPFVRPNVISYKEIVDMFIYSFIWLRYFLILIQANKPLTHVFVSGYFSWRNSANGSWFIQALSSILALHWQDMDLLTIMTRVNKKVAYEYESRTGKEFMNEKKQIPCITSMLTKEIRFKPK